MKFFVFTLVLFLGFVLLWAFWRLFDGAFRNFNPALVGFRRSAELATTEAVRAAAQGSRLDGGSGAGAPAVGAANSRLQAERGGDGRTAAPPAGAVSGTPANPPPAARAAAATGHEAEPAQASAPPPAPAPSVAVPASGSAPRSAPTEPQPVVGPSGVSSPGHPGTGPAPAAADAPASGSAAAGGPHERVSQAGAVPASAATAPSSSANASGSIVAAPTDRPRPAATDASPANESTVSTGTVGVESGGAAPSGTGAAPPATEAGTRDDLRQLIGIGPTNERKLNEAGVTRFAQIAAWTEDDVKRIEKVLAFDGRIARERWIEQARLLAAGDIAEFERRFPAAGKASNS